MPEPPQLPPSDDGTPFWLSPWPFLEPQYLGGPLPPPDDED